MDIFKGKTTTAGVARQYDLTVSGGEGWIDEAQRSMKNGVKTRPKDIREQYESELRETKKNGSPPIGLLGRIPQLLALRSDNKQSPLYGHKERIRLHRFESLGQVRIVIDRGIRYHNEEQSHQSLDYVAPRASGISHVGCAETRGHYTLCHKLVQLLSRKSQPVINDTTSVLHGFS
ncbi:hypothetical protein [Halomonas elongata]|uniref:hypothetical protein n=1 Tax=Halomonas elongata TaxID=2746 RepID=UPI0023AE8560|nr:hypothetical protein [Halomonas elongata]